MFSIVLENKNGDQLTFEQNSPFTVAEIQGLNPPDATINTSAVALLDGEKYNSAKVNMRTINVAFAIEVSASFNRINVYKVLKSKQWIRLYYDGDYRHVYIDGYIQSINISYSAMKQIVTCVILCPEPYFKDAQEMINELSVIVSSFHFPFFGTGGVGLNLLENELQDGTRNGVTVIKNSDGSVTIDGTATANTYFILSGNYASGRVTLPDWLHRGVLYKVSGDYVRVFFYDENLSTISSTNPNTTFTVPDGAVYYGIFVSIMNGVTVSNETVYPMVCVAPEANEGAIVGQAIVGQSTLGLVVPDVDYEPYEVIPKNIVFGYLDPYASVTVENSGDTDTGLIFTLSATGEITGAKIFDVLTGDFIGTDYEFEAGDQVTIDTRRGHKTITLLSDGVETNIFNSLMKDSTWLQLPASGGVYAYEVATGEASNLIVEIKHYTLYEGV